MTWKKKTYILKDLPSFANLYEQKPRHILLGYILRVVALDQTKFVSTNIVEHVAEILIQL